MRYIPVVSALRRRKLESQELKDSQTRLHNKSKHGGRDPILKTNKEINRTKVLKKEWKEETNLIICQNAKFGNTVTSSPVAFISFRKLLKDSQSSHWAQILQKTSKLQWVSLVLGNIHQSHPTACFTRPKNRCEVCVSLCLVPCYYCFE